MLCRVSVENRAIIIN